MEKAFRKRRKARSVKKTNPRLWPGVLTWAAPSDRRPRNSYFKRQGFGQHRRCQRAGFADVNNFIRTFKRDAGRTPLRYRQLHRQTQV